MERRRIYAIGMGKTGTHSMAELCRGCMRSAHEPGWRPLIRRILRSGPTSKECVETQAYVRARDRRLSLEFESSHILIYYVPVIQALFESSRFILTVREPIAWLQSMINHQLTYEATKEWTQFRSMRFGGARWRHTSETECLRKAGLFTLEGYLSYWAWHNDRALTCVPRHRLLVLETSQISSNLGRIAEFLHLGGSGLAGADSHAFATTLRHDVLDSIEETYLQRKVDEYCGDVMVRLRREYGVELSV
jgi:hypothetical protein